MSGNPLDWNCVCKRIASCISSLRFTSVGNLKLVASVGISFAILFKKFMLPSVSNKRTTSSSNSVANNPFLNISLPVAVQLPFWSKNLLMSFSATSPFLTIISLLSLFAAKLLKKSPMVSYAPTVLNNNSFALAFSFNEVPNVSDVSASDLVLPSD